MNLLAYYQIYGQLKIRLDQKMRQLQINATPATNGGPARPTSAHSNVIDRSVADRLVATTILSNR